MAKGADHGMYRQSADFAREVPQGYVDSTDRLRADLGMHAGHALKQVLAIQWVLAHKDRFQETYDIRSF